MSRLAADGSYAAAGYRGPVLDLPSGEAGPADLAPGTQSEKLPGSPELQPAERTPAPGQSGARLVSVDARQESVLVCWSHSG